MENAHLQLRYQTNYGYYFAAGHMDGLQRDNFGTGSCN